MNNGKGASENKQNVPLTPPGRGGGGPMGGRMTVQKPKNAWKTVKHLLGYIGAYKALLIVLLAIMLFTTALELAGPWLQGEAINTIEVDKNLKVTVDFEKLYMFLLFMMGVFVLNATLTFFRGIISAKLSQNTVYKLRKDLFYKISKLPIKYTDTHKHGDIMSRMTNDVENISNAVSQSIASLISSIITLIGAAVLMFSISPLLTLIAFITIPLTVFVSGLLTKKMRKYYVEQQKNLGILNGHVEEMVTGYKTVVAYGKEDDQKAKFDNISRDLKRCSIKARIWGGVMGPCMNIIGNLQYLLIAAFGGYFVIKGGFKIKNVGEIQKVLGYSKKFTRPINEIANQFAQILTALAGAERIFEILEHPAEIDEGGDDFDIARVKGNIQFKNVDFSYVEGERVLKNFNLTVGAGQKVAIVGATGSGKTTVVNLLTRFYETDAGSITIDGKDIRSIPKDKLRETIGIVLQDTVLFSETIKANIAYGRLDASDEDIKQAAETANADDFIEKLPESYDTPLSESGENISRGQRQLLSIARAVLADPKILILDEATSSVDTRTEMKIQSGMMALMKNRTSLIIAHRLSTIRDADMIVVISDGRVAEAGNHEDLLAAKGEYFKLYSNQFAGFET